MNEQKLSSSTIVFGLLSVATVLVVGAVLGVVSNTKNSPEIAGIQTNSVAVTPIEDTVSLKIIDKGDKVSDYSTSFFPGESAYEFLLRIDKENKDLKLGYQEFDFGVFLTSINGSTANPDSEFWAFYYNGNESSVGISDYEVKLGDELQFKLVNFKDVK